MSLKSTLWPEKNSGHAPQPNLAEAASPAQRLQTKSAVNVSQQLSRAKKAAKTKLKSAKPAILSGFVD
jgi:hypothetical protein